MEKKFMTEFTVRYQEINSFREMTPVSILNCLEEAAILNSEAIGLGIDRLTAAGVIWVLNRWLVIIEDPPRWQDRLTVTTWPSDFTRVQGTREFLMKDNQGNIRVRATSLWILLNREKRKPVRIPTEFLQLYGTDPQKAVNEGFHTFSSIEPDVTSDYVVRRTDIDTNHHANNTRYAGWFLEAIPPETYESSSLSLLEIEYKREARYGAVISSCGKKSILDNSSTEYLHSIRERNQELAAGRTVWRKRQRIPTSP